MTTLQTIKQRTSILTMTCEYSYQLAAYEDRGLITIEEAIKLVRNS